MRPAISRNLHRHSFATVQGRTEREIKKVDPHLFLALALQNPEAIAPHPQRLTTEPRFPHRGSA